MVRRRAGKRAIKRRVVDDWGRIENGEFDAIIFWHEDYYNIFFILNGKKVRVVTDPEDLIVIRNLFNLLKVDIVDVREVK